MLGVLFLPTILRAAFFFAHVAFGIFAHVVLFAVAAKAVTSLVECCDEDEHNVKSCFAKMRANAARACPCPPQARTCPFEKKVCGTKTVREELARDLSSTHVEPTKDGLKLVLACPGVKPADLSVSVVDRTLHVKGKTVKHNEAYVIDKQLPFSREVDLASAECTHVDGVLTIVLKKKAAVRVPIAVNVEVAEAVVVEDKEEKEDPEETTKVGESSEGEWEEMGKE